VQEVREVKEGKVAKEGLGLDLDQDLVLRDF
jgi:hypothetical protein